MLIYRKRGFTLVEIAIVLVLLGLLIGLGAALIGPLTKRIKINETRETLDAAVEAVISHSAGSRCLPGNLTSANVRKLNDAWNKPLIYIFAPELSIGSCSPFQNDTCGRRSTQLRLKFCEDQTCNNHRVYNNVAFVIVSGGPNYNIQIDNQTLESNTIRVYSAGITNIDHYSADQNRPEDFDDLVKWVTLDELRVKIGCPGAQLKIITLELPSGIQNQPYNATIAAEGGIPFAGGSYLWNYTGLPLGISGTPSSGGTGQILSINGTPACPGTYTFIVNASDTNNNLANKIFTISIQPERLHLTPMPGTTWYLQNGSSVNVAIGIAGGRPPYTNIQCSSSGCIGITPNCGPSGVTITGSNLPQQNCYITVAYRDSCPSTSQQNITGSYAIIVQGFGVGNGTNGTCTPMSLSPPSGTTFSATAGQPFSQTITVSGGTGTIVNIGCSISGSCSGLTINCSGSSATITGTPTTTGTCNVNVSWRDSCTPTPQTISGSYTIQINPSLTPLSVYNRSGGPRYYRIDGGSCVLLPNNSPVNLLLGQNISFYNTAGRCTSNQPSCSHNYTSLKNYDINNNNIIRLSSITNTSCTFADE